MGRVFQFFCTKCVLLWIYSNSFGNVNAQLSLRPLNTPALIDSIIDNIPRGKYFFIGQSHNNKANVPLEQELLFALNHKYGLRYSILEYSQSTAIILNEFLRSGTDSLLKLIHPKAPFSFFRAVKKFNDAKPETGRISFYGIDFEGRDNNRHLKKAIDILLYRTRLHDTTTLYDILNRIKNSNREIIEIHLHELKNYLNNNETLCRNLLNNYYIDLLLVANAQYAFSPRRDDAMYANFIRLYRELLKTEPNPLFLSSFGYAHINPTNSKSISNRLRNTASSPVHDSVSVIGVQYYNSSFDKKEYRKWTGNLGFLCTGKALRSLEILDESGNPGFYLLSRSNLASLSCHAAINKLDAVVLIFNMESTAYYIWE
jgi:hypothetical protein